MCFQSPDPISACSPCPALQPFSFGLAPQLDVSQPSLNTHSVAEAGWFLLAISYVFLRFCFSPLHASVHSLRGLVNGAAVGIADPVMDSNLPVVEALLSWVRLCGCMLESMSFGKTGHKLVFAPAYYVDEGKENKA